MSGQNKPMGLRIATPEGSDGRVSQHLVAITDDKGEALPAITRASLAIDYNESGVLTADLSLCVTRLDVQCVAGEITTEWNGRKYQLVEIADLEAPGESN